MKYFVIIYDTTNGKQNCAFSFGRAGGQEKKGSTSLIYKPRLIFMCFYFKKYFSFQSVFFLMICNEIFFFLSAFSMNIPNIPIQILAVTETGSANAFFSSDLSHQLITEGNAVADKLQAHFMTSSSTSQQKSNFLHLNFNYLIYKLAYK